MRRDEGGVTLVELLVTMAVTLIVMGVIVGIFVNGINAQRDATARDAATGQANAVSASLTQSLRNAVWTEVSPDGLRLDAMIYTTAGRKECRSWALVGSQMKYSAGETVRPDDATGWGALAQGVTGTLDGGAAFGEDGTAVVVGVDVNRDGKFATVSSGVEPMARAEDDVEGATEC